jgi:hypothetical protein
LVAPPVSLAVRLVALAVRLMALAVRLMALAVRSVALAVRSVALTVRSLALAVRSVALAVPENCQNSLKTRVLARKWVIVPSRQVSRKYTDIAVKSRKIRILGLGVGCE